MSAGRPSGLAARITWVTTAVAVVAVLAGGMLAAGLVRGSADAQARRTLARQVDVVAQIEAMRRPGAPRRGPIDQLLRLQNIDVVYVTPGGQVFRGDLPDSGAITREDLRRLAAGQSVSAVRRIDGRRVFVEGRPLGAGRGVALVQPAAEVGGVVSAVLQRLLLALAVGLAVAVVAGAVLAQRLARPLRHAARAALRLASGVRGERVVPAGPAEVAEVGEAVNRLAAALERSEARERQFLLSVSHELRTPLTAIKGFAESLADGVTAGRRVKPTGAVLVAEAGRLERLVADLLDLARLGAHDFRIDPAPVDLASLVSDAAEVWADRCRRDGVELRVELPGVPVVVTTDGARVRQIVDGLAENALRVTPAGEPIVLALRALPDGAEVEVRDGGPGLTPDDLEVAFERSALYERYRGVRRVGTGLGLAIVAGLAARLGGAARAGAAAEGGAAFTVTLPAAAPAAAARSVR